MNTQQIIRELRLANHYPHNINIFDRAADLIEEQSEENDALWKEAGALARESFNRVRELAKLGAEVKLLQECYQWIPVTERLPESGTHVLLCCEVRPIGRKYVCDGYYAAPKTLIGGCGGEYATEYDDEKDEDFLLEGWYEVISSVAIGDFVTHWWPLPVPPEEGENVGR